MKKEIIKHLTQDFESYANQTRNGIEFWFTRDLQYLLGYTEWRNFIKVISKANIACETAGHQISDHFVDINKMVAIGSGSVGGFFTCHYHQSQRFCNGDYDFQC